MSRFPGLPSTTTEVTLVEIMNAIRALETKVDKHDKYITHQMQTTHGDTDEYIDPDMFGASARPKYNPALRIKTSPNFEENTEVYDDQMFGFGRYVPQHYQGPQLDDTSDHTQYPPTNRAATRGNRATPPLTAPKLVGEVTTRAPMKPVVLLQIHNQDM